TFDGVMEHQTSAISHTSMTRQAEGAPLGVRWWPTETTVRLRRERYVDGADPRYGVGSSFGLSAVEAYEQYLARAICAPWRRTSLNSQPQQLANESWTLRVAQE